MLKRFFLPKKKKAVFLLQLSGDAVKIIKRVRLSAKNGEVTAAEIVSPERLIEVFRKLKFNFDPVIVSLPRINVTTRFLKVPAQNFSEIAKIVSLQAPRYLPYSADELNTGFQVISTDKEGYSEVNLIIAHKEAVGRSLEPLKEVRTGSLSVFLSSFGLFHLYQDCFPQETIPVLLIDIDASQAEAAIGRGKKYLFSRSFKFEGNASGWEQSFGAEVKKTIELYSKEIGKECPKKIIIFASGGNYASLAEALRIATGLPVEELNYAKKAGIAKGASAAISSSGRSFASLMGLATEEPSEYLNLVSSEAKEKLKCISERKNQMRLFLSIVILTAVFSFALFRHLQNKKGYLKKIKSELAEISHESRPLEAIEKRFRALEARSQERLSALDALYQLYKTTPLQVAINDFSYEEGNGVIIRGQAPELDYIFEFVERLRECDVLKNCEIKVRYATKKRTKAGEFMDFEIECLKCGYFQKEKK